MHGIPSRNYKSFSDADLTFSVTATTASGKKYPVNNFKLYYENFNSTSVPEKLAVNKVENNINNIISIGQSNKLTLDGAFVTKNDGVMFSLANFRPMNLYVRINNVLSNGVQILPTSAGAGSYTKVQVNNCSTIENTTGSLLTSGIKQKTCVEAHGYKIPLLVEDKAQNNSEAKVAHVKKIMQYYLNHFPSEVSKAIYDTNAVMAFFYDDDWSNRHDEDSYLQKNYRFQDLFSTETTTTESSENKPYLSGKRDAAFEEILHFVHDYAIMNLAVQQPSSKWGVMQKVLDNLNEQAIRSGSYYPNRKDANIPEPGLDAESYDQEYLAYSLYAYYDLNNKGYSPSEFNSANFTQLQTNDPNMVAFMSQYFPTRNALKAQFPGYPNN